MAGPAQKIKFALDTNVLIDLGELKPFAHAFRESFEAYGLAVPPTVVQELTNISFSKTHRAAGFAYHALSCMRQWNIFPYDLRAVGHGITEADTRKLIEHRILPENEFNDGVILIETALAEVPVLVTSDRHLLRIHPARLISELADLDLPSVQIIHPKALLFGRP
jgi:predicted nucleic acid-binding protein